MQDLDQLLKKLLTTFFSDFLNLVSPWLAAQALLEQTHFEVQELFTDLKQGDRRYADVVARLTLADARKTLVLTHVEIERQAEGEVPLTPQEMDRRMWHYNMVLQLREQLPVFPVVLYLAGGRSGLHWRKHQVKVLDEVICEFRYLAMSLSGMAAESLLAREEPLAWALAAFSKAKEGKAWLKLACLKRIARAGLDGVRTFLLVDAVETRLKLKGRDQVAYQELLQREQAQEVMSMELTWASEIELRAEKKAEKKYRQEGRQEGRLALVRRLLTARFGPLSDSIVQKLEAISSPEALDDLGEKLLTARSLDELGLG